MQTIRTMAGWTGTFMIGLAITLGQQYWYGSPNSHSPKLYWGMIICSAVACGCFLLWFFTRIQDSNVKPQTTYGPSSPIGGVGTTAGGDIKTINATNYYESAPIPPPQPSGDLIAINGVLLDGRKLSPTQVPIPAPSVIPPAKIKPNLVSLGTCLSMGPVIFSLHNAPSMFLLRIRNAPPNTRKAYPVCAGIEFTDGRNKTFHVQKAFWKGELINKIDIPVNEIREVVLGHLQTGKFYFYSNTKEFIPDWPSFDHRDDDGIPVESVSFDDGPVLMTVTIFNPDNSDVYLDPAFTLSENETGGIDIDEVI